MLSYTISRWHFKMRLQKKKRKENEILQLTVDLTLRNFTFSMSNNGIIILMFHLYIMIIVFECQGFIFYSPEITSQFAFGKMVPLLLGMMLMGLMS